MAGRIAAADTAILIIDMQERLVPVMDGSAELVKRVRTAIAGTRELGVPLLLTEQYPKGLGPTIEEIKSFCEETSPIEKVEFSAVRAQGFRRATLDAGRRTMLVAGIEAHVCVLQTCLDLLDENITPVLLADCTASRRPTDRETALVRLQQAGVVISTVESALFEMLEAAGTEQFKSISRLVKEL